MYFKGVLGFVVCLVLTIFILPSFSFAETTSFGCCVDTDVGFCRFLEGDAISTCPGGMFQGGFLCTPSALRPDTPVVDDPLCQTGGGCCCFEDSRTFSLGLTNNQCTATGGLFRETSSLDCSAVCGFEVSDTPVTCLSIGGFWCEDSPTGANNLMNRLTSFPDRPNDSFICYDRPCETESLPCEPPVTPYAYELFCSDGIDNSGNCLVDGADPFCSQSVSGTVRDESGVPISNVKIQFTNTDHDAEPFQDVFTTFSIGTEGRFQFTGLSIGNYRAEIIDSSYVSSQEIAFEVNRENPSVSNLNFVVSLRNAFTLRGYVNASDGAPISGALVALDQSGKYAVTDDSGFFEIRSIPRPFQNRMSFFAYKEDFRLFQDTLTIAPGSITFRQITLAGIGCSDIPEVPRIHSIYVTKGKAEVTLEFETVCAVDSYKIYRCNSNDFECSSPYEYVFLDEVPSTTLTYTDSDLSWDTEYSYIVTSIKGGIESNPSTPKTIFTGNALCENRFNQGSFCQTTYRTLPDTLSTKVYESSRGVFCDSNNTITPFVSQGGPVVCSGTDKCVEVHSGSPNAITYCKPLEACSPAENDFFGLRSSRASCQGSNNENFCVYDYTATNTNACFSCSQYVSCNDYRSESSCSTNTCGVGACEWVSSNSQFGAGICVDTVTPTCSDCNTPFNRVFGVCSLDMCESIGDSSCSISRDSNLCTDCAEFSCYQYTNKNSCVGSASQSTITLDQATNRYIRGSEDVCGISVCRWDDSTNVCYKDSDVSFTDDCLPLRSGSGSVFLSQRGFNTYTYAVCLQDNAPPQTTISLSRQFVNPTSPVLGKIDVFLNAIDFDNKGLKYEPKAIFVCISGATRNDCKSHSDYIEVPIRNRLWYFTIENANNQLEIVLQGRVGSRTFQLTPGQNNIFYFAKDHANNFEEVKRTSFIVDLTPPSFSQEFVQRAVSDSTTLDIFTQSDEPIYCWKEVSICEDLGNCGGAPEVVTHELVASLESQFKTIFTKSIPNLPDGIYSLNTICTDLAGNTKSSSEQITIDKDRRVSNPLPFGATEKNSVTLSVSTFADVTCRYTQDISLSFSQIPSSQIMNKRWTGREFIHKREVSLPTDKTYTYYVRCDYFPEALQVITFTKDTTPPTVRATYEGMPLENIRWITGGGIRLECSDEPRNGFGCGNISYCLTSPPNLLEPDRAGSCTPTTTFSNDITLTEPQTICFNAKEMIQNNEGGKVSETICQNVFISKNDPVLLVDPFVSVTNNRSLTVTGSVYDSKIAGTLSFAKEDTALSFITNLFTNKEVAFITEEVSIPNFDLLTEFRLHENLDGEIRFVFNFISNTNYGAVIIRPEEKRIQIGRQGLLGFSVIEEKEFEFSRDVRLRVSKNGNTVFAILQDISTNDVLHVSASDSRFGTSRLGKFGVIINGESSFVNTYKRSLRTLSLYYSDSSAISQLPKNVFLFIGGSLREVVSTTGPFSFTTDVTTGSLHHGSIYPVILYAENIAGRRSEQFSQQLKYDFAGPEVTNFNIFPTIPQEEQNYIEYGSAARFEVTLRDEFTRAAFAEVQAAGSSVVLSEENGKWIGVLDLSMAPNGLYTVNIRARDILGNQFTSSFEEALLIEDRIDPIITFNKRVFYVNTPRPRINFTTQESTECSLVYDDGTIQLDPLFKTTHSFLLQSDLEFEQGLEIKNTLTVVCEDRNGRRVSQNIDVIVDKRNPIYTVQINEPFVSEELLSRHQKEIIAFRNFDARFSVLSDEPTICRYGHSKTDFNTFPKALVNAHNFNVADRTPSYFFNHGMQNTFYIQCQDRAGNLGEVKEVTFSVNNQVPPVLFDILTQNRLSFTTVRNVACEFEINNHPKRTISSTLQTPSTLLYEASILNEIVTGRNSLSITCSLVQNPSVSSTTNVVFYNNEPGPEVSVSVKESETFEMQGGAIELPSERNGTIILEIDSSKPVFSEIFVNNQLQGAYVIDSTKEKVLNLPFGFNSITISFRDSAGNTVNETLSVISLSEKPRLLLSNGLSNSIRNAYNGDIVILHPSYQITSAELRGSKDSIRVTPSLTSRNVLSFLSRDSYVSYHLSLSESLLESVSSNTDSDFGLTRAKDVLTLSLTLSNGEHSFVQEELFYFHPYAEEIIFTTPSFGLIHQDDLKNANTLAVKGALNQQNYLFSSNLRFNTARKTDVVNLSLFNEEFAVSQGRSSLEFTLVNDLSILTRTFFTTFYNTLGPQPEISIYPTGSVTYVSRPSFEISFMDDPARITNASIRTELGETLMTYSSALLSQGPVFSRILRFSEPLPLEGTYLFTMFSEDDLGNRNQHDFRFSFENKPLELQLITPKYGVSRNETFSFEVQADRAVVCYYGERADAFSDLERMALVSSTSFIHRAELSLGSQTEKEIKVQCVEEKDVIRDPHYFTVSVDKTPLKIISINLENKEVINNIPYITNFPLFADIKITTDKDSYCRYELVRRPSSPQQSFEQMLLNPSCASKADRSFCFSKEHTFRIASIEDKSAYTLAIQCKDKSLSLSEKALYEFQVDLSQGQKVRIVSPESAITSTQVPITIITNMPAEQCVYGLNGQSVTAQFSRITNDRTVFNSTTTIAAGNHEITVSCTINGEVFNASRSFLIDNTPPTRGTVLVQDTTSSLTTLFANALNFTDEESGIAYYEYVIGVSPHGQNGWNSIVNWTQTERSAITVQGLTLENEETYYFSVRAYNRVGLVSDVAVSAGTQVLVNQTIVPPGDDCTECGPKCGIPCEVGSPCIFDSDCFSSDLVCSNEYLCELASDSSDLGEPIINRSQNITDQGDPFDIQPVLPDTETIIVSRNNTFLYLLLAFGMLIGLAGGGYYVYAIYYRKEDEDTATRSSSEPRLSFDSKGVPLATSQVSIQDLAKQTANEQNQKKKEALKIALRKKLVEEQKKEDAKKRSALFKSFDSGNGPNVLPKEKDSSSSLHHESPEIKRLANKKIEEALEDIKKHMKDSSKIDKHFPHISNTEVAHDNKLLEKHKELVSSIKNADLEKEVSQEDSLSRLRALSGKKNPVEKSKKTLRKETSSVKKETEVPKKSEKNSVTSSSSKTKNTTTKSTKNKKESNLDKLKNLSKK